MDAEIKPGLAALVLALFLIPIGAKFYLAGQEYRHVVNQYYITAVGDELLLQIDDQLFQVRRATGVTEDISRLLPDYRAGTQVAVLRNGDLLLKLGSPDAESSHLARCEPHGGSCSPFLTSAQGDHSHHSLRVHPIDDGVFVSSGGDHKISHYTDSGELIAEYSKDLRYPKRVEIHPDGSLYFANTNRQRIERLSADPVLRDGRYFASFGTPIGSIDVSREVTGDSTYTYPLAAQFFAGQWWVINMDGNMHRSRLFRFDAKGKYLGVWDTPDYARPLDLLQFEDQLLIADASTGVVRRVDAAGKSLPPLGFEAVSAVALPRHEALQRIQRTNTLMSWWIGLVVVGLVVAARRVSASNSRNSQPGEIRPTFSVLNSGEVHMLISNIEVIPNKRVVRHLGLVQGSTVRAKHAGRDIMASFKNIFGGELAGYTELLQESREEAVARMSEQAKAIGANAVINVRFSTSAIAAGASEILAYGTAVEVVDV